MTVTVSNSAPSAGSELAGGAGRDQTRARYPDEQGYVERDGVRVFYEVYGEGERPCCSCRRGRSSTPGAGSSRSPTWRGTAAWSPSTGAATVARTGRREPRPTAIDEFAADALAVMDATGTEHATLAAVSCGALWATVLAADHPERVDGVVYIGPAVGLAPEHPEREVHPFDAIARDRGAVGEVQQPLLATGLPRLRRVLLRPVLQRAALDQADRGLHRMGASRRRPRR